MKRTVDSSAEGWRAGLTRRRVRRAARGSLAFGVGVCMVSACLYDPNERCGDNLVDGPDEGICVCPAGKVQTANGCVECGPHEEVVGNSCVCEDGYVKNDAGDCEEAGGAGGAGGDSGTDGGGGLPMGLGMSCSSNDDCADTEATFCDTFMSHTCQVQGCSLDPNDCYEGAACCDFSAYGLGTLCVPGGCP